MPGDGYDLDISTKMYANMDIKLRESYMNNIMLFSAMIENVDFKKPKEAAAKINSWVAKETKGHLKNLISEGKYKYVSIPP